MANEERELTDSVLDELERLWRASPHRWKIENGKVGDNWLVAWCGGNADGASINVVTDRVHASQLIATAESDSAVMVAAHNWLPALIAAARRGLKYAE